MSRPRVTVLARDQGLAPLAWLAPFTECAFKARAKNVIEQILPEPQASLLTGILLGDDSGLPKSVQDAFRTTGSHTSLRYRARCKTKPDVMFVFAALSITKS